MCLASPLLLPLGSWPTLWFCNQGVWKPDQPCSARRRQRRGSHTHRAFPHSQAWLFESPSLSLGSRPERDVFFCVHSFRNPPSLCSPRVLESMGTEHQHGIPAPASSWVSSLQEGSPSGRLESQLCGWESTLGAAAAGAGGSQGLRASAGLEREGVARGVHFRRDRRACILIHALAATCQSWPWTECLGDLFSSVKWDNKDLLHNWL